MLIKDNDITTLRRYVRMNFTATSVKSMPDIYAAERKFLVPLLTEALYNSLDAQVDTNNIVWPTLVALSRAVIAPLSVWLDLPFMQVSIEDSGIKTRTSDNSEAAHRWEYNELKEALANKGMAALEDLVEHLIAFETTYTWVNPIPKQSIFRTGKDFSRYVFLEQPNRTFLQLQPLIREVEDHYIRAAIGSTFFEYLRDKQYEGTAEELKAVELIKKAIAHYTVARAVERMPVKITPSGITTTLQASGDATSSDTNAKDNQLDLLYHSSLREGDSYALELRTYLNALASDTIFITYKNSSYYTAPILVPVQRLHPNLIRTGVIAL